ncbi:FG-GAP-like repeat-containing protein [Streptomyces purpureus]|uniref:Peptidoglycan recognition protein family domain-containing protein n=1 Tax=Streptomyces purpureus TaxID=1951 RepID=A0A918HE03_9ACTN|nr:FG-GAP-like repeat-containing protein [Streptomyces purpureus]GGT57259.1 hypothetical protein GCM10014713_58590 [Streptomyces purpureus]
MLGGTGVVTVAIASPSDEPVAQAPSPRKGQVFDYALKGSGTERELPSTETKTFSMVGITWDSVKAKFDGEAEVRTRSIETGEWTEWKELEKAADLSEGSPSGVRGATEPLWVGPSDAAEARVIDANGSRIPLPKGLELTLVDPGLTPQEAKAPDAVTGAAEGMEPAAFAMEETTAPATSPTESATDAPAAPATSEAPAADASASASPAASVPAKATSSAPAAAQEDPAPQVPTALPSTTVKPPIISRAQWGADETKVEDPAEYIDKIQAVYIHHTTDSNNYSCSQSPAIVRAIMLFHIQGNGWNDLGYNFLVDKCGRIFEGRGGGADLPVRGAHTYGFNSYSTGIALIGNFEETKPTKAALESAARVAAYKLGQYGVSPTAKVTLTRIETNPDGTTSEGADVTFNTISGHRDAFATACPGVNLYNKLAAIRDFAAKPGRNSAIPTADFNRDGITDLVAGLPRTATNSGRVTVLPGTTDGPSHEVKKNLDQNSEGVPGASVAGDLFGTGSAWGDINGDGYADLVVGSPGKRLTSTQKYNGSVTVLYGPGLNTGGYYGIPTSLRVGEERLGTAVTVGDFNADGKADILGVAPGKPGRWWAWNLATGQVQYGYLNTAAYTAGVAYASAVSGDFNKDGYTDVAVNYRDLAFKGKLLWLKGSATGLQRVGILDAPGGRSLATGDINGDGYADVVVGQPSGTESGHTFKGGAVTTVFGSSTGLTSPTRKTLGQDSAYVPGAGTVGDDMGASVSVGDVNLDGFGDIMTGVPGKEIVRNGTQKDAGFVILLRGASTGPTATGSTAYAQGAGGVPGTPEPGDRLGSSVSLTDLSGYLRADIAIGAEGEDASSGTILQIDNSSTNGIVTSSGRYYSAPELGAPTGVRIGQTLMP